MIEDPLVVTSARKVLSLKLKHSGSFTFADISYIVVVLDQDNNILCRFGPFSHIDWKRKFCCERCLDPKIQCRWEVRVWAAHGLTVGYASTTLHPFAAAGVIQCWPGILRGDPSKFLKSLELRARRDLINQLAGNSRYASFSDVRPQESHSTSLDCFDLVWQNGIPVSTDVFSVSYEDHRRFWTGVRTPNFGLLKDRGMLPVNNHTVALFDKEDAGYQKEFNHYDSNGNVWASAAFKQRMDHIAGVSSPIPSHLDGVYDHALRRVAGVGSRIVANLAQDIGEIGQTVESISNALVRTAGALKALKERNFQKAWEMLYAGKRYRGRPKPSDLGKTTASNWLEWNFGIRPLLSDIEAAVALLKKNKTGRIVFRVARRATRVESIQTDILSTEGYGPVGTRNVFKQTEVRIGLRYKIPDEAVQIMAQFGFTNPINLAWELAPFSFVYDWIHPIGPYLQALSQWDGLVFVNGFEVWFTRQRISDRISASGETPHEGAGPYTKYSYVGAQESFGIAFERKPLTSFPLPYFPTPKLRTSIHTALNALALLRLLAGR